MYDATLVCSEDETKLDSKKKVNRSYHRTQEYAQEFANNSKVEAPAQTKATAIMGATYNEDKQSESSSFSSQIHRLGHEGDERKICTISQQVHCKVSHTTTLLNDSIHLSERALEINDHQRIINRHQQTHRPATHHMPIISNWPTNLLYILILRIALEHLNFNSAQLSSDLLYHPSSRPLDFIQLAEATECMSNYDCGDEEKICHESKCICRRERPIEDKEHGTCLQLALINEPCLVTEQCLGSSRCLEGVCSCGSDAVTLFNPSAKLYYCHEKRRLNQECNYDSQCPDNAFCSTKKYGCLCQNGFGHATVNRNGIESVECLPKACTTASDCESEYHQCEDHKCMCLATHFNPHTAGCYKFGSSGGEPANDLSDSQKNITTGSSRTSRDDGKSPIVVFVNQFAHVIYILYLFIAIIIICLILSICLLLRRHYLGYCWTAHKKEYEPNSNSPSKNGHLDKNSINNKSFRKRNGETDEDDDEEAADRSSLMPKNTDSRNCSPFAGPKDMTKVKSNGNSRNNNNNNNDLEHRHVGIDIDDSNSQQQEAEQARQRGTNGIGHNQSRYEIVGPLPSSTSTPV